MKKKLLIVSICLVSVFLLTACGAKKQAVTVDGFTEVAEKSNMKVQNVIDQFEESPQVLTATVAYVEEEWQLEHYTLDSVKETENMFNKNKKAFLEAKTSSSKELEVKNDTYEKYVLETFDKYKVLIKIDTMFIYGNVPIKYKSNAIAFLKELGY